LDSSCEANHFVVIIDPRLENPRAIVSASTGYFHPATQRLTSANGAGHKNAANMINFNVATLDEGLGKGRQSRNAFASPVELGRSLGL